MAGVLGISRLGGGVMGFFSHFTDGPWRCPECGAETVQHTGGDHSTRANWWEHIYTYECGLRQLQGGPFGSHAPGATEFNGECVRKAQ